VTDQASWAFRIWLFAGAIVLFDIATQVLIPLSFPIENAAAARSAMLQALLSNVTFVVLGAMGIAVGLRALYGGAGARWSGLLFLVLAGALIGAIVALVTNADTGIYVQSTAPDAGTAQRALARAATSAIAGTVALVGLGVGLLVGGKEELPA